MKIINNALVLLSLLSLFSVWTISCNAQVYTNQTTITNLSLSQRRLLSDSDRLIWLEKNGMVPADADDNEWQLSTKAELVGETH